MSGEHSQDSSPARYEFLVRGELGEATLAAFSEFRAERRSGNTLLRGALADQAALHGVLAQMEALGIELFALRRLPWDEGHVAHG